MKFRLIFLFFLFIKELKGKTWTKVNLKCVSIWDVKTDRKSALEICQQNGGKLYSIRDEKELSLMNELFVDGTDYWVGLTFTQEGYKWDDGHLCCPSPTWWAPGEPNTNSTCARIIFKNNQSLLYDRECFNKYKFICSRNADYRWSRVNEALYNHSDLCGVGIMPNCPGGPPCEHLCRLHPDCYQFVIKSNLCINTKKMDSSNKDQCIINLQPKSQLYRKVYFCS